MITLSHPLVPTVSYKGEIKASIAEFSKNHLHEYDVYLIEVSGSRFGVGIELFEKAGGAALGVVTIY